MSTCACHTLLHASDPDLLDDRETVQSALLRQACFHCVRSLDQGGRLRHRGRWFCSDACRDAAAAEYLPVRVTHTSHLANMHMNACIMA